MDLAWHRASGYVIAGPKATLCATQSRWMRAGCALGIHDVAFGHRSLHAAESSLGYCPGSAFTTFSRRACSAAGNEAKKSSPVSFSTWSTLSV